MSAGNSFILGFKGQRSRLRVTVVYTLVSADFSRCRRCVR